MGTVFTFQEPYPDFDPEVFATAIGCTIDYAASTFDPGHTNRFVLALNETLTAAQQIVVIALLDDAGQPLADGASTARGTDSLIYGIGVGSGGAVILNANSGVLRVLDNTLSAFARAQAADPVFAQDLVTLGYLAGVAHRLAVPGPEGPPGDEGEPGPPGRDGAPGSAGAAGSVGPAGPPGADGADGEDGAVSPPGSAGAAGAAGSAGATGPPGVDGADGADGETGPPGLQGPRGYPGAQGPEGPEGPEGEAGPPGPQGVPGPVNRGVTTVNFGAFPGVWDASTVVTGQPGITAGSVVLCCLRPVATADHSADEHTLEELEVFGTDIVAGVGFTVRARQRGLSLDQKGAAYALYGAWSVGWMWV